MPLHSGLFKHHLMKRAWTKIVQDGFSLWIFDEMFYVCGFDNLGRPMNVSGELVADIYATELCADADRAVRDLAHNELIYCIVIEYRDTVMEYVRTKRMGVDGGWRYRRYKGRSFDPIQEEVVADPYF